MAEKNPRKRIFISSRIQGQLVVRLGTYWLLYHFVLWHAMFAYHYVQHRLSAEQGHVSFQELYGTFVLQYYPIIMCAVGMLPIFLIDLVRLSHRIAGPLYRFTQSLQSMTAGEEVRRVRLRKGDLMDELEQSFNAYVDVYERHRQSGRGLETMTPEEAERIESTVEAPRKGEPSSVDKPVLSATGPAV